MSTVAESLAADCPDRTTPGEALYSLEGMWCTGCALAIEANLARLPGVTRVGIDYISATLFLEGDPAVIDRDILAPKVARLGYRLVDLASAMDGEARLDAESHRLTARLLVAALFGMWTMLASLLIYVGAMPEPRLERVLAWVSGAFSLPVLLYAGVPFYVAAWRTMRAHRPGMDVLVSLGVVGAVGVSLWLLWQGSSHVYFDTAVMLILLLLTGHWIELLARYRSLRALKGLVTTPAMVRVLREVGEVQLAPRAVALGERILVASGEVVPLDGELLDAGARLDLSPLTGESHPRDMTRGDRVAAGSRNLGEALTLVVSSRAGECRMDRLYREMQRLQITKGDMRHVAERFAAWLSPLALALALSTLAVLLVLGVGAEESLVRALSVLVIACPCAVALAVPLASLAGSARALERGVVFREPAALEQAGRVRSVAFDKTGTLTQGELRVADIQTVPWLTKTELLRLAAEVEQGSEHPVGRAIRCHALAEGTLSEASPWQFQECPGRGRLAWLAAPVRGKPLDDILRIGSPEWLEASGVVLPKDRLDDPAHTRVDLASGRVWLGVLWLADVVDPAAAPLIASLRRDEISVALISGDRASLVHRLGAQLGFEVGACYPERTPEQKLALVAALPYPSLYVGDGINDAPALAAASLGVSPLGASMAAREAAAIQLLRPGPGGIRDAIDIARLTRRVMVQNLWLSILYNTLALGLVVWMTIPPQLAVLAMVLSSLSVVGNSARMFVGSEPR